MKSNGTVVQEMMYYMWICGTEDVMLRENSGLDYPD
jgi:hypothetical protein